MNDRLAEARIVTNVPSALAPREASQQTLLREGARWAGMAAVLEALAIPACALEAVAETSPDGHAEDHSGPQVQVTMANSALERLLQYAPGRLAGCPLVALWDGPLYGPLGLGTSCVEGHARRRDGSLVPARLSIRPLGGAVPLFIGTLEDLRPWHDRQTHLLGSGRWMAQGVVAGVVHEVNNAANLLLANISEIEKITSQLKEMSHAQGLQLHELEVMLGDAREATERIIGLVRDLVQMSHPEGAAVEAVDLAQLVEVVLRLCRPMLHGLRLQQEIVPVPLVRAQRPRLLQVLLNLLINAVHALEEVEVERRALWVRLQPREAAGQDGVCIEIEDSGCGIPVELLDRVYEPFFTTKGAGRGTGLGLGLSRAIVEQHGGTMRIASRAGQGTLVTLWFPAESQARSGPDPTQPRPNPASRCEGKG